MEDRMGRVMEIGRRPNGGLCCGYERRPMCVFRS